MTPEPPPLHFDLSEVSFVGGVTPSALTPCHKGTYEECRQHAAQVLRRYRRRRLPVAMNCRGQSSRVLDGQKLAMAEDWRTPDRAEIMPPERSS